MPRITRDNLASALRTTVLSPIVTLEARTTAMRAAIDSRNNVLQLRGRAATQALGVSAVADENATLRQLLGLASRLEQEFIPAEVLPARGFADDFTLALSVGSNAGVEQFLPVVTADGLVGMVRSVDPATSYAISWAHPDFRVSAMSVDGQAFGIVQPHLGSGVERWLLEMRGVRFRAKLDTGTLIVSSGLGATYPRGIAIGVVVGELATPEKWARTYLIMPAVLPSAMSPLLILRRGVQTRDLNGVWTSITAADSGARAVAAAGDSIARIAAMAEVAARRAALDSLIADSLASDSTALRRLPPADSARRADSVRRVTGPPPSGDRP